MTKLRSFSRIAALFLLLIVIVIIPERVLAHSAAASLAELFTYQVAAPELNSHSYADLDLWQKIALLNEADIVVQLSDDYVLDGQDTLLAELQTQLLLLQKYGAIPALPPDTPAATATQKRYISAADPRQAVTVWVVNAQYSTCSLYAYLDAENYTVYDIYLSSDPDHAFEQLTEAAMQGYIDYLRGFAAAEPEQLSLNAGYTMEQVYLSLILENAADRAVPGYCYVISGSSDE